MAATNPRCDHCDERKGWRICCEEEHAYLCWVCYWFFAHPGPGPGNWPCEMSHLGYPAQKPIDYEAIVSGVRKMVEELA
jgi:hypothetical protein